MRLAPAVPEPGRNAPGHREISRRVAAHFRDWGIPTVESLLAVRRNAPRLPVIASGGLRQGLDVAKVLGLGASLAGMAGPFLQAAAISTEAVLELLEEITRTLRIAMFAVGARDIEALQATPPVLAADGKAG
jgi:isopentenyl-diphosphate delta-isomerase